MQQRLQLRGDRWYAWTTVRAGQASRRLRESSGFREPEKARAEAWLAHRISEIEEELLREQRKRYAPTIEELQDGIRAAIAKELAVVVRDIAERLGQLQEATAQQIGLQFKRIHDRLDRIEAAPARIEARNGADLPANGEAKAGGLDRLQAMQPERKQTGEENRRPKRTSPRGIDWDAEFAAKPPDESWAAMARRLSVDSKAVHAARRTRGPS